MVRFERPDSPFLKYLTTSTLALLLFVALAVLSAIRGKEPANRESSPPTSEDGKRGQQCVISRPSKANRMDYRLGLRNNEEARELADN